jgi:N-acetylglutamate synthase-like GNAT family acetyltransferase
MPGVDLPAGYTLATGFERMDFEAVHACLTRSYWSPGVSRATVERAAAHSMCFGIFHQQAGQVAFARVVTDKTTFAYLADVFVLEAHRGRGLSKCLVRAIQAEPDLQGLRRFLLATRDAHGLYAQFGFGPLAAPSRLMERMQAIGDAAQPREGAS